MAALHDGTADKTGTVNGDVSITLTGKTTAGSNRCAIITLHWFSSTVAVSSITYNGSAVGISLVAERVEAGIGLKVAMYRLLNPPTASSDVVITWASAVNALAACSSYNGVELVNNALGTDGSAASSPATLDVTSAAGDLTADAVVTYNGGSNPSLSVGADQTAVMNQMEAGAAIGGHHSYQTAGTTPKTMSWTWTGTRDFAMVAANLKAATEAGGDVSWLPSVQSGRGKRFAAVPSGFTPPDHVN